MGWQQLRLDRCMLTLRQHGRLVGACCMHVGGFLVTGEGKFFQEKLQELKGAYKWGHWEKNKFASRVCSLRRRRAAT